MALCPNRADFKVPTLVIMLLVLVGWAAPIAACASASPAAQAVLAQEQRWVNAAARHDPKALARILVDNFIHITYQGTVRYRKDELAAIMAPRSYAQHTSAQTVDIVGDVAIVHGLNTITQKGHVVLRLRYTDVYTKEHGIWRALCAQETAITH